MVITGYVGQISLAQLAIAGIAGFTAIEVAENGVLPWRCWWNAPRHVGRSVGGLPATRARGMSLAVATLAVAVAIEQLVLASTAVPVASGGGAHHGRTCSASTWDLGARRRQLPS